MDLGLVEYQSAWDFQEYLLNGIVKLKIENRNIESLNSENKSLVNKAKDIFNYLIFCEHYHVYTIGKSGDSSNLLISEEKLNQINASFLKTNRGGDITYHGPGQLVMYPIFDLGQFFSDVHKYLRFLEEAVIQTLAKYNIVAGRYDGFTGVWIEPFTENARKICAIGVRTSRWVTMHGIGFNINTDMEYFNHMNPCGIDVKNVTSMQKELGSIQKISEIKEVLLAEMSKLFEFQYI